MIFTTNPEFKVQIESNPVLCRVQFINLLALPVSQLSILVKFRVYSNHKQSIGKIVWISCSVIVQEWIQMSNIDNKLQCKLHENICQMQYNYHTNQSPWLTRPLDPIHLTTKWTGCTRGITKPALLYILYCICIKIFSLAYMLYQELCENYYINIGWGC